MANYRDIYTQIMKYTDGFIKDGKLPFEDKDDIANAEAILKKRYKNVDRKGLDYKNSDINGADYVVQFEESLLLDSEGDPNGLNYVPDKSPENAKLINAPTGEVGGGMGESIEVDERLYLDKKIKALTNAGIDVLGLPAEEVLKKYQEYCGVDKYLNEGLSEDIEKHDDLNPDLFKDGDIIPEVKDKLLEIVAKFKENLKEDEVELDIKDIVILGSNASFNYTKDSDVDLHIIADLSVYPNQEELATKLYNAYKTLWNNKYDPMIKQHEVELYVEPEKTGARSNGIYSLYNGWLKEPVKDDIPEVNKQELEKQLQPFEDKIQDILANPDTKVEDIDSVIDELYLLRQESILKDGEYGIGNLVFKEIRNQGYLQKLKDKKVELENDEMTLEDLNSLAEDFLYEGDELDEKLVYSIRTTDTDNGEMVPREVDRVSTKERAIARVDELGPDYWYDEVEETGWDESLDDEKLLTRLYKGTPEQIKAAADEMEDSYEDDDVLVGKKSISQDKIDTIARRHGLEENYYRGYGIDFNIYGQGEYSVQVGGDDVFFDTREEAKKFIDNLENGEEPTNEELLVNSGVTVDSVKDLIRDFLDKQTLIKYSEDEDGFGIELTDEALSKMNNGSREMYEFNGPSYLKVEKFTEVDEEDCDVIQVQFIVGDEGLEDYLGYPEKTLEEEKEELLDSLNSFFSDEATEYNITEMNKEYGDIEEDLSPETKETLDKLYNKYKGSISKYETERDDIAGEIATEIMNQGYSSKIANAVINMITQKGKLDDFDKENLGEGKLGNGFEFKFPTVEDTLKVYLQWEGIIGFDDDLLGYADTSKEDLDSFLQEEGVIGYTNEIWDILQGESAYCSGMDEEDFLDICDEQYIDPETNLV